MTAFEKIIPRTVGHWLEPELLLTRWFVRIFYRNFQTNGKHSNSTVNELHSHPHSHLKGEKIKSRWRICSNRVRLDIKPAKMSVPWLATFHALNISNFFLHFLRSEKRLSRSFGTIHRFSSSVSVTSHKFSFQYCIYRLKMICGTQDKYPMQIY